MRLFVRTVAVLVLLAACDGVSDPIALPRIISAELRRADHGKGVTVAVGHYAEEGNPQNQAMILVTSDGQNWRHAIEDVEGRLLDVAYGNGVFVAAGENNLLLVSENGRSWRRIDIDDNTFLEHLIYGGGHFWLHGHHLPHGGFLFAVSPDGIHWEQTSLQNFLGGQITTGDGGFLATGYDEYVQTSPDGVTWTTVPVPGLSRIGALGYSGGAFFGIAFPPLNNPEEVAGLSQVPTIGPGEIVTSLDGVHWNSTPIAKAPFIHQLHRHRGVWYGIDGNVLHASSDGRNWLVDYDEIIPFTDVASHGDVLVVVGVRSISSRKADKQWKVQEIPGWR